MLCSPPQSAIIPFDKRVDKNVTLIITRSAHAVVFVEFPCVRFVPKRVKERLILIPFSPVRAVIEAPVSPRRQGVSRNHPNN